MVLTIVIKPKIFFTIIIYTAVKNIILNEEIRLSVNVNCSFSNIAVSNIEGCGYNIIGNNIDQQSQ